MYPNERRVATTRNRKGKFLRSPSVGGGLVDRRRGGKRIVDILECAGSARDEDEIGEVKDYDGIWENGTPKGNGVFPWTDGRFCVEDGFDQQQLDGLCCSGIGLPRGLGNRVPFSGEGAGNKLYGFSSLRGIPRICVWESDGEDGDIMCEIVDDTKLPSSYLDGRLSGVKNELMYFSPSRFRDESKKPGEIVRFGHKNYHLMLSLQLGVRFSVGKQAFLSRELKASDFDPKQKSWTKFPPEGSRFTPAHKSPEFRWKDYCPAVFRHLREQFRVDPTKYILSICGNGDLRELSSPGKSGSLFFLTEDDRFMIKTVKKSEVKVLLKMLPSYYQHVCRYENSLVTKFFGVHCVKSVGGQKIRFIVMGNLFCSEYPIHERYDLKGSSYGRKTDKPECDIDETTTRKDLDLNLVFFLSKYWFREFLKQIDIDRKFLEAEGIMDYSLLVGLHFRSNNLKNQIHSSNSELYQIENFLSGFQFLEAEFDNLYHANRCRKQPTRLGVNTPARAERISCAIDQFAPGGANIVASLSGESYNVILQFGIIDILQDYDISKKLEHAYKSLQADPTSISAVDPKSYSRRFREFIAKIFAKDA